MLAMMAALGATFGLEPGASAQVIELPASPADIGSVAVNGTLNGSFVIGNAAGEADLDITDVVAQPKGGDNCALFTVSAYSATIPGGDTGTVSVDFSAATAGTYTCTLRFASNDTVGGPPDEVTVQATATEPDIAADKASVDFGTQPTNTSSTPVTVTITNNGNQDLTINSIAVSGTNAAEFAATPSQTPAFTIAPTASETVDIVFTPTAAGTRTASLDIDSDDPDTPTLSIPLTGVGGIQDITADVASLSFGDQVVGTPSAAMVVTITNNGGSDLTVNSIAVSGANAAEFVATPSQTPTFTIAPAGNATVSIVFTPTTAGTRTASLDIDSDDPDTPTLSIPLDGNGVVPDIAADVASLSFGDQVVNTSSAAMVVTITNNGDADLTVTNVAVSGTNAAEFAATPSQTPTFIIAPAASETVSVVFTPTATGARAASLDIDSDDPDTPTLSIPLDGNGVVPDIAADVASLSFGDQVVNTSSAAMVVTITNNGDADLTVTNIAVSGADAADFTATPSQTPTFTIAPMASESVSVVFTPTATGARTASLDIASDDPDTPTLSIPLDGNGVVPDIAADMPSLSFGDQVVNTSSTAMVVTITNNGTATLTITNIAVNGVNAADFAATPSQTPTFTIAPAASETVSVVFTPTAAGARTASLDIASDDPDTPTLSIPLDGNGIEQDIDVDPITVSFGDQRVGTMSATITVTITNAGTADLLVTDIALVGGDTGDFTITPSQTPMFTIPADGFETVDVFFTPGALGPRATTLQISSDDPDEGTISVPLDGNGVEPDVNVDPPSLAFGQILVGDTSAAQTVIIRNVGDWDLTVTNIALGGANPTEFAFTPSQTPTFTIAPGGDATVSVTCQPSASGALAATLDITTDDPDTPASSVTLDCTGMDGPEMTLSTNTLDFADVLVGTPSVLPFDIFNAMGTFRFPLNVTSVAVVSGDTGDFAVDITTASIDPGMSQTVNVTFTPQAPGARAAVVRVTSDDAINPVQDVVVMGVGREPDISVDPLSLDFGLIATGQQSSPLTVTVTNIGNSDLTISNVALGAGTEFAFVGNTSTTIGAGLNETWSVTCTPSAINVFNDTLVFTSDDPDQPTVTVTLRCEGTDQILSTNPAPIVFPDTYINDAAAPLAIDIINETDNAVTVMSITVTDAAYTVTAATPFTLADRNAFETITLDFTPLLNQPYPATLQLMTSVGPINFAVTGRGVESVMQIATNGVPPDPISYDFGSLKTFTSSAPQVFTISNVGTYVFTVASVSLDNTNDFTLAPPPAMSTLQPNQSIDFTITANPRTVGTRTGTISIQTDIRNSNTATFGVIVEGTSGDIAISPSPLDFGPVDVQGNLPETRIVTVTNPGATATDNLEIQDIQLSGDPAYQFAPGQPTSATLGIDGTFDIVIQYTPLVESASDVATLTIFTDAASAMTAQVPITGNGIDRHIQVAAMNVSFPETVRNPASPAQQLVAVSNTGDAPLDISMIVTGGPDAAAFSVPSPFMQVAPNASEDLLIEFSPTAVNPNYSATLTIINDDNDTPMVEITLSGAGVLPNVAMVAGASTALMQTGQGVPLRLSELEGGPMLLQNLDADETFSVREVRVMDMNGAASNVFRVVGFEPDTQIGPGQSLTIDVELLSDEPGEFQGMVEVYLGADPVSVGFLNIQGRVVEIDVRGGCDVAATGSRATSSWLLVLFALGLLVLGRSLRRLCTRARTPVILPTRGGGVAGFFLVAWFAIAAWPARAAHADNAYNIDLTVFRPVPSAESSMLSVENAVVGHAGAWSLGLSLDHAVDAMTVRGDFDGVDRPVAARTAAGLMFSYAFMNRFEAGLAMPFLQQSGDMPTISGVMPVNGSALGDLGVHLKAALLQASSLSLAGSALVTVPTASDGMLAGIDGPSVHVRGIAALSAARAQIALNAGFIAREGNKLGDLEQGNALSYGLAVRYRLSQRISAVGEVFGIYGLGAQEVAAVSPAETAFGLRYRMNRAVSVNLGAGVGLPSGAGAPLWRGIFMFSYSPGASDITALPKKPRRRKPTPADRDGDGVADKDDRCPDEAEDEDMFADEDGCPEPDNDEDGIDDSVDKCPLRAEDKDGFQDEDGCPDNDNDGDKIPDADDKCPDVAEDLDGFDDVDGCDDPDNDRDGIPDVIDMCVLEPETINGNKDDDGCPDKGDALVMMMADRLELFEPIQFRGDSARLTPRSENVLGQVAATMRAQTEILKVRIGVHVHPTDGKDRKRSRQRAKAIRDWLIKWGIVPERLEIKAYGSESPLVPRNQRGAKAINDRVEFVILEKAI